MYIYIYKNRYMYMYIQVFGTTQLSNINKFEQLNVWTDVETGKLGYLT